MPSLLHFRDRSLNLWQTINRKKRIDQGELLETPLKRCLTTIDLTLLGIGHMIGAGIFVLTGTVVKAEAGPATILSYIIAGIAALLSALCYAEFGARVPKAGSAYTYTYIILGEFWAFLIGWNIILEHLLGAASVARSWSASFDSLFNMAIRNATLNGLGEIHAAGLSKYADFIALLAVIVVMVCVATGAKLSITVNSIFTVINLVVIFIIICAGLSLAKLSNWTDKGFLQKGWHGVFAGAATCFYAYIGFEGIAIAGEEAQQPSRSLPIATGSSMAIVTLLYVGCSAALTLMVPSDSVDLAAPFPAAFALRGVNWVKYIVALGALSCISTSMLGSMFSMPRAVYSMASDGLLFSIFSRVNQRTQTPIVAIVCFGLASGFCALLLDIDTLVEFLSIGTLLSFTIVATSILILRYQPASSCQFELKSDPDATREDDEDDTSETKKIIEASQAHENIGKLKTRFRNDPYLSKLSHQHTTSITIFSMITFIVIFAILLVFPSDNEFTWWRIMLLIIFAFAITVCLLILMLHEKNVSFKTFQVPFVPFLPTLSVFINVTMMLKLGFVTWMRLVIWLAIGFFIYFVYGMRNSHENKGLANYADLTSYGGTDNQEATLPKLQETIQKPQPQIAE